MSEDSYATTANQLLVRKPATCVVVATQTSGKARFSSRISSRIIPHTTVWCRCSMWACFRAIGNVVLLPITCGIGTPKVRIVWLGASTSTIVLIVPHSRAMSCWTGGTSFVILQALTTPTAIRVTAILVTKITSLTKSIPMSTNNKLATTSLSFLSTPNVLDILLRKVLLTVATSMTRLLSSTIIPLTLSVTFSFDECPSWGTITVLNGVLQNVAEPLLERTVTNPIVEERLSKRSEATSSGTRRTWLGTSSLLRTTLERTAGVPNATLVPIKSTSFGQLATQGTPS